jgi:DNA-binding phage protein
MERRRVKKHRESLLERLKKPEYAAAYLTAVLREDGLAGMLEALKDVIDAAGSSAGFAREAEISRSSLYKMASRRGNPTVANLRDVLLKLGLDVSIAPADAVYKEPEVKGIKLFVSHTYQSSSAMTSAYPILCSEETSELELVH